MGVQYHVVFIPKYRKRTIFGVIKKRLGDVFHELARPRRRIDLDGVEVATARRLDARGGVRQVDPLAWIARLGRGRRTRQRLELAGKRQELGNLHDLHGLGRPNSSMAGSGGSS